MKIVSFPLNFGRETVSFQQLYLRVQSVLLPSRRATKPLQTSDSERLQTLLLCMGAPGLKESSGRKDQLPVLQHLAAEFWSTAAQ